MEPGPLEEPRKGRNSWKGREGQVAASTYLADLERDAGTDPEQQAVVEEFKSSSVIKSPLWLLGFGSEPKGPPESNQHSPGKR